MRCIALYKERLVGLIDTVRDKIYLSLIQVKISRSFCRFFNRSFIFDVLESLEITSDLGGVGKLDK